MILGHFIRQNHNQAEQFVSLVPILDVPNWSLFSQKMGIYFKASCLKIFWAVQMIKIVFACHQFQQTKTALIHVDHIVPAIKKECLKDHR